MRRSPGPDTVTLYISTEKRVHAQYMYTIYRYFSVCVTFTADGHMRRAYAAYTGSALPGPVHSSTACTELLCVCGGGGIL